MFYLLIQYIPCLFTENGVTISLHSKISSLTSLPVAVSSLYFKILEKPSNFGSFNLFQKIGR